MAKRKTEPKADGLEHGDNEAAKPGTKVEHMTDAQKVDPLRDWSEQPNVDAPKP